VLISSVIRARSKAALTAVAALALSLHQFFSIFHSQYVRSVYFLVVSCLKDTGKVADMKFLTSSRWTRAKFLFSEIEHTPGALDAAGGFLVLNAGSFYFFWVRQTGPTARTSSYEGPRQLDYLLNDGLAHYSRTYHFPAVSE